MVGTVFPTLLASPPQDGSLPGSISPSLVLYSLWLELPLVTQPPPSGVLGVHGGAGPRRSAAGVPGPVPSSSSSAGRTLPGPAEQAPSTAITALKCAFL